MTDYGETPTGFRRKTFSEVQGDIKAKMRSRIDTRLVLDEIDWVGNTVDVFSDELDLAWQALEVARNGFDPANAEGALMVALAALTGTRQLDPTFGHANVTLGIVAAKNFAPGDLVAHVLGDPDNRWENEFAVASTTAGNYPAVFVAQETGPQQALAGTLTIIAATQTGWLSITNATDADAGTALETPDDLRVRREEDLEDQASGTAGGIKSDVNDVVGVISTNVLVNDTEADTVDLPKHSIRVIIWDGLTLEAANDDVAQGILDSKGAATTTVGATTGTAVDANGDDTTINFDRAAQIAVYVEGEIEVVIGADPVAVAAAVKLAIIAGGPVAVGERAVYERIKSRPFTVPGVTDVLSLFIGIAPSPTGVVNIDADIDEILVIDTSNIDLTITEQAP